MMRNVKETEILLQTFDWNTAINYKGEFYKNLLNRMDEIRDAGFTAIWLPPPWKDTSKNRVGYFWQDFVKDTAYGTDEELKKVAHSAKKNGIKVIYDIVLNHRNMKAMATDVWQTIPLEKQRVNIEYKLHHNLTLFDNGQNDLNLTNKHVFGAFVDEIVNLIQNYSAEGFRFDFAKGYDPYIPKKLIAAVKEKIKQNNAEMPELFLVGEYWDENQDNIKKVWSDSSDCYGFDFPLQAKLKNKNLSNEGVINALNANSQPDWRRIAVTFVDNHDTGFSEYYQNKEHEYANYDPEGKKLFVEQGLRSNAYAYILLTPGTPCIYWPHWDKWGNSDNLKGLIHDLILIRKGVGIHASSPITLHSFTEKKGVKATIRGSQDEITIGINNLNEHLELINKDFNQVTYYGRQGWGFIQCAKDSPIVKILDTLESFERDPAKQNNEAIELQDMSRSAIR